MPINHFSQFIYAQNNLKELTIKRFDFDFKYIINKSINILNINYEKKISTMKYKLTEEISNISLINYFPNLTNLNFGGNYDWIFNSKINDFTLSLKSIKIISNIKNNKISKIKKKLLKYGKEFTFEYLDNYIKAEEEEEEDYDNDDEDEEYENEEKINYKGKKNNNLYRDNKYQNMKDEYYKKSSDKKRYAKYCDRLYYGGFILNLKENNFIKEFCKQESQKMNKLHSIFD